MRHAPSRVVSARVIFALCALLLFSGSRAAAQQAQIHTPLPAEKIGQIEALIKAEMSRQSIPGLSVAVVANGQMRWSEGYGLADVENAVPARPSTVYRLGSISKPVTATAIMQLVERGKIDLDAPVQKYCSAFPEKQWPITTREVLGHLSGIRHYKSDEEFNNTRHFSGTTEALSMFKDDPLLHEPGVKYTYTTFGYTLLGCEIEGASGMTFADYVRENVFKPSGMDRMRVDSISDIIPNRAQGYRKTSKGELINSPLADNSYKVPGGGFVSTAEDLAKFAVAVQGSKLLKKETTEQMFKSLKTREGKETGYGLGWSVNTRNGQRNIGHSGAQQRVSTFLHMQPEQGLAVVIMANLEGARLGDLVVQISDILLK
jgi:serine beta-lactamase-like protein LACTB, mitochondrial